MTKIETEGYWSQDMKQISALKTLISVNKTYSKNNDTIAKIGQKKNNLHEYRDKRQTLRENSSDQVKMDF